MRTYLLTAAILLASIPATASANVKKGVSAWNKGEWAAAVIQWERLAERGNPDAQFNMAQAYKLGRGVPYSPEKAAALYYRAAKQGHIQAQDNFGLSLYQDGHKADAIPWLEKSAARDEKRALLVLGTLLFNGDIVEKDMPRAYALISRAANLGMDQALASRAKIEAFLPIEDRRNGERLANLDSTQWAQALSKMPVTMKAADPKTSANDQAGINSQNKPDIAVAAKPPADILLVSGVPGTPLTPGSAAHFTSPVAPAATKPKIEKQLPARASGWKVQLGAFQNRATAQSLWRRLGPVFEGGSPVYGQYGRLIRLQVAGFDSHYEAKDACRQLYAYNVPCFVVQP